MKDEGEIYIKSVDYILRWLGAKVDNNFPDPESYKERVYIKAELPRISPYYGDMLSDAMFNEIRLEKRYFLREHIAFNGRTLTVWREKRED